MQRPYQTVTRTSGPLQGTEILITNNVIKNTYLLLSMTLLFSAVTAGLSMISNVTMGASLIGSLVGFGLLFATQALRNSSWGLVAVFAFTGVEGFCLGPILNSYISLFVNGPQLIMSALAMTAVVFMGLSGYAMRSQKDFSYLSSFMFTGLIVLCLGSLLNIFFHIPMLQLSLSAGMVVVMSGFILMDTSRIINGGERNYVMATLSLYLSILNLFLSLLRLLAAFTGDRRQ